MGLVAVGGQASASVTGADEPGVTVEGNSQESKVQVVAQQPLVASVLEVVMGLGGWAAAASRARRHRRCCC